MLAYQRRRFPEAADHLAGPSALRVDELGAEALDTIRSRTASRPVTRRAIAARRHASHA